MTDLSQPVVTICNNAKGQNDCCDLRITGLRSVDDLVHFREEIDKTGFKVVNPVREAEDSVVWTLQRPRSELISDLHILQLQQAVRHVGMQLA